LKLPLSLSSYLVFALAAALTPPLASRIGRLGGSTFIFTGKSSVGKTLALRVAASAYQSGEAQKLESTNFTAGGAIALRTAFGGTCIALVDLKAAQAKGKELAHLLQTIIFSGTDYAPRITAVAAPRAETPAYSILLMSAERPVAELFTSIGLRYEDGDRVRAIDVPVPNAAPGGTNGIFNKLGNHDVHDAIGATERALEQNFGVLVPSWARQLARIRPEELKPIVQGLESDFLVSLGELSNLQARVAKDFALVAATGVLAARRKLFPSTPDSILDAARVVFEATLTRLVDRRVPSPPAADFLKLLIDEDMFPVVRLGKSADPTACANGFRREDQSRMLLYVRSSYLGPSADVPLRAFLQELTNWGILRPGKGKRSTTVEQKGLPKRRYLVFDWAGLLSVQDARR